MSTRLYPFTRANGPQLRILLPNFTMKIVHDKEDQQPKNIVKFHCSMEMTKHDIKNYLEKIYNINVVSVRTRIALGKFEKGVKTSYVIKDDDVKIAYVTLPKDQVFEFPDISQGKETKDEERKNEEAMDMSKEKFKEYLKQSEERPGLPGWFPA